MESGAVASLADFRAQGLQALDDNRVDRELRKEKDSQRVGLEKHAGLQRPKRTLRSTSAAPDTASGGGDKVSASTHVARPSHNADHPGGSESNSSPKVSEETSENRDNDNDNDNGGENGKADDIEETVGSGADIDAEGEYESVSAELILMGPAGGTSKEALQAQAPSSLTTSLPDSMATWQATAPVSNLSPDIDKHLVPSKARPVPVSTAPRKESTGDKEASRKRRKWTSEVFRSPELIFATQHSLGEIKQYEIDVAASDDGLDSLRAGSILSRQLVLDEGFTYWEHCICGPRPDLVVPSTWTRLEFVEKAVQLKILLLLSPLEYRLRYIRPCVKFDPLLMQAYAEKRQPLSNAEVADQEVSPCLFPGLVAGELTSFPLSMPPAIDHVLVKNKVFLPSCDNRAHANFVPMHLVSKAAVLIWGKKTPIPTQSVGQATGRTTPL
ncbi:hypothetical protein E8E11_010056 [Didymella keratinophila]|nr:hypothetical protein E8E11_010056 [Didymella keratinophila]